MFHFDNFKKASLVISKVYAVTFLWGKMSKASIDMCCVSIICRIVGSNSSNIFHGTPSITHSDPDRGAADEMNIKMFKFADMQVGPFNIFTKLNKLNKLF